MSFLHHLEILIFGKRASEIKRILEDRHNEAESLISQIEDERKLAKTGYFLEENKERKNRKI